MPSDIPLSTQTDPRGAVPTHVTLDIPPETESSPLSSPPDIPPIAPPRAHTGLSYYLEGGAIICDIFRWFGSNVEYNSNAMFAFFVCLFIPFSALVAVIGTTLAFVFDEIEDAYAAFAWIPFCIGLVLYAILEYRIPLQYLLIYVIENIVFNFIEYFYFDGVEMR